MTRTLASKTVQTGAIAAGFLLFAGGAAQADPDIASVGNAGIGNGNQVVAPIQAPIDVCGNGVAVLGVAGAGCQGGSAAVSEDGQLGDMASAGNRGIGNGNQVQAPIQAPIDACGNAVGALVGVAGAGCQGGSAASMGDDDWDAPEESVGDMASGVVPGASQLPATQTVDQATGGLPGTDTVSQTTDSLGVMPPSGKGFTAENEPQPGSAPQGGDVLSGLTGGLPTDGLVGLNNAPAQDEAPSQTQVPSESDPLGALPGGDAVGGVTDALPTDGVLDVQTQDQSPVDATSQDGDAASQGADAAPQESAPQESEVTENGGDMVSAGNNGIANGNQVQAPIQVPVDVSGNGVGVLGVAGAGSTGGAVATND